ncbi:MAG: hypothetical protein R2932_04555 [Caldilineaceae bacterium]
MAINTANERWVRAFNRISPQLLCEFLDSTGPQVADYFATLDPHAMGGSVDWAGPEPAPVWLDLAREYTERWHHQQHIRDGVGKAGMTEPRYLHPILDTFLRALPHTFRTVNAEPGTLIHFQVTGPAGGDWFLLREPMQWQLYATTDRQPTTMVTVDEESTWRLLTRGIDREMVKAKLRVVGDEAMGFHLLNAVSIIA